MPTSRWNMSFREYQGNMLGTDNRSAHLILMSVGKPHRHLIGKTASTRRSCHKVRYVVVEADPYFGYFLFSLLTLVRCLRYQPKVP